MKLIVRNTHARRGCIYLDPDLIDAILQLQSIRLSSADVKHSLLQLREYLRRFRTRLNPSNALSIERLVVFLTGLLRYIQDWAATNSELAQSGEVIDVNQLMTELGGKIAGMNLPTLLAFLRSSKVGHIMFHDSCVLYLSV
jgi:chromosome transmission fidelity protein 1